MKYFLSLLFLVHITSFSFAQKVELSGKIFTGEHNDPIPFVNISLYRAKDTTKLFKGTVSDIEGNYIFENIEYGNYYFKFSAIGYKTYTFFQEVGKVKIINLGLEKSVKQLDEVTVNSSRVSRKIDKTEFIISNEERLRTNNSLGLMKNIPRLHINELNHSITTLMGGAVKILINGLNASENELIALKPAKILRIEFYDFPPARYANSGYAAVINVITKKNIDGGNIGINVENAPLVGFGNDIIYFNFNKKKTQIKLNYNISYRNYKSRVVDKTLEYTLNGHNYKSIRKGYKSPLVYQDHSIDLSFIHIKDSDYLFQFKISPSLYKSHLNVKQKILNQIDTTKIQGIENDSDFYQYFRPNFDIYFSKKLKKEQELIFDLTGTSYLVTDKYTQLQNNEIGDTLLFDKANTQNNKYSVIGELMLTKKYKKMKLNYGFRYTHSYQKQILLNNFDNSNYQSQTTEQYIYAELIGSLKKLSYQFSLGESNNTFNEQNSENNFIFLSFRPIITMNYNFNENSQLKFRVARNPQIPSLSELSNNKYLIDKYIIYQGNPKLEPYNQYNSSLQYFLTKQKFSIDAEIHNIYVKNPISSEYLYSNNFIRETSNNQNPEQLTYGYLVLQLNPFKNQLLQLSLAGGGLTNHNQIKTYNTDYTNNQTFLQIAAVINLHITQLQMEYKSVYEELSGQFLAKTENYSAISLFSKGKSWSLALKMYYPLDKSTHYEKKTVTSAIVKDKVITDIYDNGKMLTINFTYNFDFGKNFRQTEKQINNSDNDTGVLKND